MNACIVIVLIKCALCVAVFGLLMLEWARPDRQEALQTSDHAESAS